MRRNLITKLSMAALALISTFALAQTGSGKPSPRPMPSKAKTDVVFVCACLKTESCECMTISKREGPCACGTEGGPPLRAVPKDSNWAKKNLDAIAH